MKEQDLIDLKFNRTDVTIEESGAEAYYYYTYNIGSMCLMTNANNEYKNDNWNVQIFYNEDIAITDIKDVITLINILERNKL